VVFRRVERREVVPVGLDFGAIGHGKAHGAKDGLQALDAERHRVQTTLAPTATWQGHVQTLGLELLGQLGIGQGLTSGVQQGLDLLLGLVDGRATGLLVLRTEGRHALEQLGQAARLAQKAGLGIFQVGRSGGFREGGLGRLHQLIEVVHGFVSKKKANRWVGLWITGHRVAHGDGRCSILLSADRSGCPFRRPVEPWPFPRCWQMQRDR